MGKIINNLKISVIIPVYNEEKILSETLLKYPKELKNKYNLEIILSDGGSTDETLKYDYENVDKVVRHNADYRQTIAEGRNNGKAVSNGEVLFFINADSYSPNIEEIFDTLVKWDSDPELQKYDAFACLVLPFPEESDLRDKIFYGILNRYFKFLNFIGIGMGRGECQIVKREMFDKVGGYNNEIVAGEDFDLYHRITKVGKIKFMDNFVIYESPRRFKQEGYFKTLLRWFLNSVSVLFRGKSFSKEWNPIR